MGVESHQVIKVSPFSFRVFGKEKPYSEYANAKVIPWRLRRDKSLVPYEPRKLLTPLKAEVESRRSQPIMLDAQVGDRIGQFVGGEGKPMEHLLDIYDYYSRKSKEANLDPEERNKAELYRDFFHVLTLSEDRANERSVGTNFSDQCLGEINSGLKKILGQPDTGISGNDYGASRRLLDLVLPKFYEQPLEPLVYYMMGNLKFPSGSHIDTKAGNALGNDSIDAYEKALSLMPDMILALKKMTMIHLMTHNKEEQARVTARIGNIKSRRAIAV